MAKTRTGGGSKSKFDCESQGILRFAVRAAIGCKLCVRDRTCREVRSPSELKGAVRPVASPNGGRRSLVPGLHGRAGGCPHAAATTPHALPGRLGGERLPGPHGPRARRPLDVAGKGRRRRALRRGRAGVRELGGLGRGGAADLRAGAAAARAATPLRSPRALCRARPGLAGRRAPPAPGFRHDPLPAPRRGPAAEDARLGPRARQVRRRDLGALPRAAAASIAFNVTRR